MILRTRNVEHAVCEKNMKLIMSTVWTETHLYEIFAPGFQVTTTSPVVVVILENVP